MKGTFSALDLGSASDLDLESGIDLDLGSASDLDLGEEDETKERKRRCLKLPGYKSQHRKSAKLPGLHNIKHSFVFLSHLIKKITLLGTKVRNTVFS